jgi:Flp pilus assembly protein TadG
MMQMFRFMKSERGQSLVEFALILPIFIVVLFGIMEFGRLWEITNLITSASREGARVAAISGTSQSQAINAAQNVLSAANIDDAVVSVSGPNAASEVTVTVSLDYTPMTGNIIPGLDEFSLSRSTIMRWEG